jgi:phenylacetic acid degradation operon negative regulatory protein
MGADTARRLLLTVMGELILPCGGAAWTSTFIDVLGRLDVEPGTTRQALSRTATSGWLEAERIGRRTRWRLTPSGEHLLVEGTKRIYDFAGPASEWDGRWVVVLASVPENDRATRHLVQSRLSWAGLGSPLPGVWIGTQAGRLAHVEEALTQAAIVDSAQVFVAEHSGWADMQAMVESAWDLRAIEDEYEQFLAEFSSKSAHDPLARLLELVNAWRRFPWRDPGLPRQLLPRRWKGAQAAALFHDRHARWAPAADAEWRRLSAED